MPDYRLRIGMRFRQQGRNYTIEHALPNDRLEIKDLLSGEVIAKPQRELVAALFAGKLELLGDLDQNDAKSDRLADFCVIDLNLHAEDDPLRLEAIRRSQYVSRVLGDSPVRWNEEDLTPIIRAVSEEIGDKAPPSWVTLYRWLRDYESAGRDVRALAPAIKARGNRLKKFKGKKTLSECSEYSDKSTNHDKPKLNDEKVLYQAKKTLEIFLPLEADGYCVTSDTLYDILIGIAANRGTTESVCAELAGAPDPETIRCYFRGQFTVEQLQDLQRSINDGLAANWPKKLRRGGPVEVAFDFHDRPYYGKQEQKKALWVRGEAKDGTTRFYRVATAYAILHGQRVTLAIRFVLPGDQTVEVVKQLRQTLLLRALRIGVLYLDKGFSGVPVL